MKKLFALICALFTLGTAALAAPEGEPVYGRDIKDGTYKIEVESSSSMFRVVDCELTVADGKMTALMTLSGTGYEKLFMGTGEEAASAPEGDFIYFKEDGEGRYTYDAPIGALDVGIPCAAFSIRKQTWYDRTLVFRSDSLPEGALKGSPARIAAVAAAAVAAAAVAILIFRAAKRKQKKNERH